jgi:hypothetical protein
MMPDETRPYYGPGNGRGGGALDARNGGSGDPAASLATLSYPTEVGKKVGLTILPFPSLPAPHYSHYSHYSRWCPAQPTDRTRYILCMPSYAPPIPPYCTLHGAAWDRPARRK